MTEIPKSQDCPICRKQLRYNPRYPYKLCQDCLKDGVVMDGKLTPVQEIDMRKFRPKSCKVNGVDCIIEEAYMGGTIVHHAELHLLHLKSKGQLRR